MQKIDSSGTEYELTKLEVFCVKNDLLICTYHVPLVIPTCFDGVFWNLENKPSNIYKNIDPLRFEYKKPDSS